MSYYYTPWLNEIGPQEIFLVGLGPSGIIRGDFLLSWEADGIDRLWLLTIILNKIWVPIPGRSTTVRGENRTPTNLLVKAVSFRDHTSLFCSTLLKHLLSLRAFHLRQGSEGPWIARCPYRGQLWVINKIPLCPPSLPVAHVGGVFRTLWLSVLHL